MFKYKFQLEGYFDADNLREITMEKLSEGVQESFWQFSIPSHDITQMFLVAGRVTEPNVVLDKTHVNFSNVLLGATAYTLAGRAEAQAGAPHSGAVLRPRRTGTSSW